MGRKFSSKGYDVKGDHYNTLEEVAEAFDLDRYKLARAYGKYRDMEFAVEYVKTYHKKVNRNQNRVYKVRGNTFNSIQEVCKFLGVRIETFKKVSQGFTNLDEVADKIEQNRTEKGYVIDGVYYGNIEDIETAYKIPYKRLMIAYTRLQDVDKALKHALNHDYEKRVQELRNNHRESVSRMFKSKRKFKMSMAYSTVSSMRVVGGSRGIRRNRT